MSVFPKRNFPCPCGSGLKYKKCCYGKAVAAAKKKQGRSRNVLIKDLKCAKCGSKEKKGTTEGAHLDGVDGTIVCLSCGFKRTFSNL